MNASSSLPRPSGPPAVVLLSGGLDSATVLAVARRDGFACHTLAFDYGQRHRHELSAAARVSAFFGAASHRVFTLDLRAFGGSALTADIAVPKDRDLGGDGGVVDRNTGIPATYVPARNLVFLSLATAYAETLGSLDLFIGVNAVDYSGYPDCRPAFIAAFEQAATLGTRAADSGEKVSVHAPLVRLSKADIIRLGTSLGVDYSQTHSCYDPIVRAEGRKPPGADVDTLACGHCDSCILRREGFRSAGLPDPTRYA